MIEFARDASGTMPRVFGVNHHPEVVDRARQMLIVDQKLERGEVSAKWVAERREALTRTFPDEDSEQLLRQTSEYTLQQPLRFHLCRQVRLRPALGLPRTRTSASASACLGGMIPEAPLRRGPDARGGDRRVPGSSSPASSRSGKRSPCATRSPTPRSSCRP